MLMIIGHDRTTDRTRHRQARCPHSRHGRRVVHVHRRRPRRPPGPEAADRLDHPDGPHPPRHEGAEPQPADPRVRAARQPRRPRVRRLGSDLPERSRGRPHRRGARGGRSQHDLERTRGHRPDGGRVRPAVGVAARRRAGEAHRLEVGPGDGRHRRHRHVQGGERLRPARHGVVRFDRGVPGAVGGPRVGGRVRAGPEGQRRQHLALADLRLCRAADATCRSPTARRTSRSTSSA